MKKKTKTNSTRDIFEKITPDESLDILNKLAKEVELFVNEHCSDW